MLKRGIEKERKGRERIGEERKKGRGKREEDGSSRDFKGVGEGREVAMYIKGVKLIC